MEVSGRRHAGSDDTNTGPLCDPCQAAGDTENAESYCVDCHEFLCLHCAKAHRRQTLLKHHKLLGRDEMPKKKITISSDHTCRKHDGKSYDYFCNSHNVLCCSVCLNLDHRQCTAEYITDLVERFDRSGEYEALRTKMRNLDGLIGETKTRTVRNIATSKRSADQLMSDIKNFRAEINAYLDSLEKQVIEKISKVKNEDIKKMSATTEELDTINAELDQLTAKMEGLSKLNNKKDLVIATKQSNTRINMTENRVAKLTEQNGVRQLQFNRNDQILDMLQSTGLGTLSEMSTSDRIPVLGNKHVKAAKAPPPFNIKHHRNIGIKHKKDKDTCIINGSVILDTGRLAIADNTNDSVKVVDTHQGNIISYTRLSSSPWDITYTAQNQLVVTAPGIETLIFLDVGKTLTVNKELEVHGMCRGIDYTDNKLIVGFYTPDSVKILNMDGHVLSSISNDPNGKPLFSYPTFVISNADSSAIYVSDPNQDTVTKLDMTGRVKYKYTSNDCKGPCGMVVDKYDNLYIAGIFSSTVCILSADGRQINKIEVDEPISLALCEDTDQLFVCPGSESCPTPSLSVYKLH